MAQKSNRSESKTRYGIGEWYGKSFVSLSKNERIDFSNIKVSTSQICIPRSHGEEKFPCVKPGGICSLRLYQLDNHSGDTKAITSPGSFATLCPHRFKENNKIFQWVGQKILRVEQPIIITEVGFLVREKSTEMTQQNDMASSESKAEKEDVGKIDYVLINPDQNTLHWCALELQAVYFSGAKMSDEYPAIRDHRGDNLPFPTKIRRPDYRSSGPKRLMPQLQIKVPTLRRWGKKLAVIVDKGFYDAMGKMDDVIDISNSDIAWFIVDYLEDKEIVSLTLDTMKLTTLERAVEGLTAGTPVSLSEFERRIEQKLNS